MQNDKKFDETLLQAIDEALATLGEPIKKIVYFHIENKYLLKVQDIPDNPELFALALNSLLGAGGAYIETLVLKKICQRFGLKFERLEHAKFELALEELKAKKLAM